MTDDKFIDTWIAWDKRPSDTTTSLNMVDACISKAQELDIHFCRFRDKITAARRKGATYHQAYDTAIKEQM